MFLIGVLSININITTCAFNESNHLEDTSHMNRNIPRIVMAVIVSLIMGYIGLYVGSFLNSDNMPVIFVIITMGAFIMNEIHKSRKTNSESKEPDSGNEKTD